MALPLVIWAAPAGAAAITAAGATFAAGSSLRLQQAIAQFQGAPRRLPPVTGREGTATLEEMIQDAWAGARLPVGFVPPPGGPDPVDFGAIAAAAAAGAWDLWQILKAKAGDLGDAVGSLWDWLNSRAKEAPAEPGDTIYPKGTYDPNGSNIFTVKNAGTEVLVSFVNNNCTAQDFTFERSFTLPAGASVKVETYPFEDQGGCSNLRPSPGVMWRAQNIPIIRIINPDGSNGAFYYAMGIYGGNGHWRSNPTVSVRPVSGEGIPYPTTGTPKPPIKLTPDITPTASFKASSSKLPTPIQQAPQTDQAWTAEPGTGNTTDNWWYGGPGAASLNNTGVTVWNQQPGTWEPKPLPTPTVYVPPAVTTWTTTTLAGAVQPQAQPEPKTTATGSHFVNGVEIPATSARATLEAIATELQRVEEKAARLLREMAKAKDLPISVGELLGLIQTLLDYITGQRPAGSYSLLAPCELDANGNRLEKTAGYEGGYVIDQMNNKLDALALLLQHHKDIKQPTCGEAEGLPSSNVTVHFTEVI